jgi:regulator of sirC expression with transglutaminase-like and TPR domain
MEAAGYRGLMSIPGPERLVRLVRRADADLAEVALLIARGCDPDLDVEVELLRIDALADQLRGQGVADRPARETARLLADHLGGHLGFHGDPARAHDPDSSLLHRVLDNRQGLPITLSALYVAIARRLQLPAFAIALPGHVVVGLADEDLPVVLDPAHGGMQLEEPDLVERVRTTTAGRLTYRRAMLRPSPAVHLSRRMLHNLTRALRAAGRTSEAIWTVEMKLALPNRLPEDHRDLGELELVRGGFDVAARAFEHYLELTSGDSPERDAARRAAIDARARLN